MPSKKGEGALKGSNEGNLGKVYRNENVEKSGI
jgi:hypothetical protein